MKIKDKRKLDNYGILAHVNPGECFEFATEKEDGDKCLWIKTDDENSKQGLCVELETGEAEWVDLTKRCVIVSTHVVITDES